MLNDSGFYKETAEGSVDTQNDIRINSAGHYKLIHRKRFETVRPAGRLDIQLLYIAKGSADFVLGGQLYHLSEGNMILYLPNDSQSYYYELSDSPDIYWIHFTGVRSIETLREVGFPKTGYYFVGVKSDYCVLFDKVIKELQFKRTNFLEIANLHLLELLHLMSRHMKEAHSPIFARNAMVEDAIEYFHQAFNKEISISEYAQRNNISSCWFIRSFKKHTGMTPQNYIIHIRMNKAKELLNTYFFNNSEIAEMVGYQNPLYFSRLFKKVVGVSPSEYRKKGIKS